MDEQSKNKERAGIKALTETVLYVGVFLLTLVLFLTVKPLVEIENVRTGVVAQSLMAVAIAACLCVGGYFALCKKLTVRRVIILLLIIGYILRVGYMLYTAASARQQDTYTKNFDGHEAYAWTIFTTGKLPTTNDYQFYHPPLNAILQAGFMRFTSGLSGALNELFDLQNYFPLAFSYGRPEYIHEERYFLYSACQVLSVCYSFVACTVSLKILELFDFKGKTKILLAAFVVLYPRNMQFSGMLNNDGLSFMFAVIAVYFALKWQKKGHALVDILACGVAVGLGMMAKLSTATVCLPIACAFLFSFSDTLQKREGALSLGKTFLQYGLFLLVCAPLGLWFQVYAKVRFDQPLGYVFSNLNHKLYTGDRSFFSRFILCFDFSEYFGSLWCRPFEGNYYLFNYALRSSIFGEFSYWQGEGLGVAAVLLAYIAALLLFIAIVYCIVRGVKKPEIKGALGEGKQFLFAVILLQSQVLSEIYFYIQMPYGCTMDFRYIMPLILGMALTIGYTQKALVAIGGKTATALDRWLTVTVIAFLTVSALFYCVCI